MPVVRYPSCPDSERNTAPKKFGKTWKSSWQMEIKCYNSKVAWWTANSRERNDNSKNFEKLEKSSWQSEWDVLTYKSSQRAWMERKRTTLYLVNWIMQRQTITPWTIKMDCLSVFRNEYKTANENSWVYLLDKLFKTWFELLWEFRYNFLRVWSWLRTNAGGVPNTCKSNGALRCLVANGWVTREEPAFQWGTTVGNDC